MTLSLTLHPELPAGMPPDVSLRVHDALYKLHLEPLPLAILTLLVFDASGAHVGRDHALSIAGIQARLLRQDGRHYPDRAIKAAVKELIETHEVPVGSCRGEGHGYFIVATEQDRADAARPVLRQALSELRRFRILAAGTALGRGLNGQQSLPTALANLDLNTINSALAALGDA